MLHTMNTWRIAIVLCLLLACRCVLIGQRHEDSKHCGTSSFAQYFANPDSLPQAIPAIAPSFYGLKKTIVQSDIFIVSIIRVFVLPLHVAQVSNGRLQRTTYG